MKKLWNMVQLVWMLGGGPVIALMALVFFSWKITIMIFGTWCLIWIWSLCVLESEASKEIQKAVKKELGESNED